MNFSANSNKWKDFEDKKQNQRFQKLQQINQQKTVHIKCSVAFNCKCNKQGLLQKCLNCQFNHGHKHSGANQNNYVPIIKSNQPLTIDARIKQGQSTS